MNRHAFNLMPGLAWLTVMMLIVAACAAAEDITETGQPGRKTQAGIAADGLQAPDRTQAPSFGLGTGASLEYTRPRPFEYIPNIFGDLRSFTRDIFQRRNLPYYGLIAAGTGVLLLLDQKLVDQAQRLGGRLGISAGRDRTRVVLHYKSMSLFQVPSDAGSAMYYIGDGWVHMSIVSGFYAYGQITGNVRALRTTSQLLEGLATTGIVIQILKRSTGRESPDCSTTPGGVWRPFPNQTKFNRHTPKYDAFPSGHMATAMMTLTVLSSAYPDAHYIKPVGFGLMTLLGYQMLNNGVHWASDYPLGWAIGYSVGKIVSRRGMAAAPQRGSRAGETLRTSWRPDLVLPLASGDGAGLRAVWAF